MTGLNSSSVTSLPDLPGARSAPASPAITNANFNTYSAPATPSIWQTATLPSAPSTPSAIRPPRPRVARRMESRQSLRLTWGALPSADEVDAPTAPERRLQYTLRSAERRSVWPLINLLCASVGRSFVSFAGGLLADGVRDTMQPMGGNGTANAGFVNATATALNISRSAIMDCTTVLTAAMNTTSQAQDLLTDATQAGAASCLTSLNAALASTSNDTLISPGGQGAEMPTPSFVPGGVLLGLGIALFSFGAGRFAWDTSKIDRKRAALMASLSFSGFAGVVVGNSVARYALDNNKVILQQAMALPRLLGTYLIFLSIPKSFSTCEIVRGDARLPYREIIRGQLGAWGPTIFGLYATVLNNPKVDAPVHEVIYSLALMMLIIANALSETNVARARAKTLVEPQTDTEHDAAAALITSRQTPERMA